MMNQTPVVAWLRGTYWNYNTVPILARESSLWMRTLWDQQIGPQSWEHFRKLLYDVMLQHTSVPRVTDWQSTAAEWICPIDDDDAHLEGVIEALQDVPSEFSLVAWGSVIANLTQDPAIFIRPVSFQHGPMSCGYAIRKRFLKVLTPRQQELILRDHYNTHRYVDFAGSKYLMLPQPLSLALVTPASCHVVSPETTRLPFASRRRYQQLLEEGFFHKECQEILKPILQRLMEITPEKE